MEDVSIFIVCTCQKNHNAAGHGFDSMQFAIPSPKQIRTHIFHCGSSAEFYIKPISSCIDDNDYMKSMGDVLVFTGSIPVLPYDFRGLLDTTNCLEITPYSDYPGFVQLRCLGKIKYNWHCKMFEFRRSDDLISEYVDGNLETFLNVGCNTKYKTAGPAIKIAFTRIMEFDTVLGLWCPQWPKEAKDWPFRQRKYGWPTTAIIHEVVQNGCHVVFAKHPTCRNDVRQRRLSFSVAEVILLQSWTPVQQIIYHMLRFFAKRELIRKDCLKEDEVLCTFHFKTLMLWSCEEMSSERWISSSVIETCSYLLRKLSEWLKKRYCPNYFIPQANLFHERMSKKIINETIRSLNEFGHFNTLNEWFAMNYVKPALEQLGSVNLLQILEIIDSQKLKNFDWQLSSGYALCVLHNRKDAFEQKNYNFCLNLNGILGMKFHSSSVLSTVQFSSRFPQFGKVLYSLHAAVALRFQKITYDSEMFTEFVREVSWKPKVVGSEHHNFPIPSKTSLSRSDVLFLKAQDLMENYTGLNSPREFKLISQLSKELLRNLLYGDDFKFRSFKNVALVYMAAIYFSESCYETVIDLCSAVLMNQTPDDDEEGMEETLNAGCLFYFDDVVRIIGFFLLFRRIGNNFQYNRRRYLLDLRLTPEVFAQYLIISSNERSHRPYRLNYDLRKSTFLLDEILMTILNRKFSEIEGLKRSSVLRVYQRIDPVNKLKASNESYLSNEDQISQLLVEYSLETLETFYNDICKDFDIHCNAVYCYRAAYLYKFRKYPEVLDLCERILDEPDLQSDLKELAFANVMVLPPFDSYFDTDVQCLLGFSTLLSYLSPQNEDLLKIEVTPESTFQQYCAREIYSDKSHPAQVLVSDYHVKCHYFVGEHFLARYLKVRCLIDCNHSRSEITQESMALKCSLPFEQVIHCFLRQKLLDH